MYKYNGSLIKKWGGKGTDNSKFDAPSSICIKNNKIFIADTKNNRIQIFDIDGNFIKTFGNFKDNDNTFGILNMMAISLDDKIIVTDYSGKIQVFDIDGIFINKFQLEPRIFIEYFAITPDNKIVVGSSNVLIGNYIYTIDGTYERKINSNGKNFVIVPDNQMIVYNKPSYSLVYYNGKQIHEWKNNCIEKSDEKINVLKIDENNVLIVASRDNIYFFR